MRLGATIPAAKDLKGQALAQGTAVVACALCLPYLPCQLHIAVMKEMPSLAEAQPTAAAYVMQVRIFRLLPVYNVLSWNMVMQL